jgi:hypothetical protein
MADDAPKPDTERGTAVDRRNLLFAEWDDRLYLHDPSRPSDRDLDRMLERDGKARQLEQALTLPLRQARWTLKPGKGDRGELEFVREALTTPANAGGMSTPIQQIVSQATSAVSHRRSFHEKVWAERDGRLVYDKLAWRPQTTCRISRGKNGEFTGFRQYLGIGQPNTDPNGWTTIEPKNAWVHIHGTHRDPLGGISDLDVAYNCHVTKAKIRFLWHQFLENSALPKTAVHVGTAGQDRKQVAQTVAGLHNAGVVALGKDDTLTHFPVGSGEPFMQAMAYLDAEAASSVLAGFLNLTDPAKTGGSYALSKDGSDFFTMAEQAKLVELGTSLSNWVVGDLVRWNFGPQAAAPLWEFDQLAYEDVQTSLQALESLAAARGQGVPAEFIDLLVVKVSEMLGLPVDKVQKAIDEAKQTAPPTQVGQVGAAVGAGAQLVKQAANPLAGNIANDQRANLRAIV